VGGDGMPAPGPLGGGLGLSPITIAGSILATHHAIPVEYDPFEGMPKTSLSSLPPPEPYQWPLLRKPTVTS
jgi:hypothetical protein